MIKISFVSENSKISNSDALRLIEANNDGDLSIRFSCPDTTGVPFFLQGNFADFTEFYEKAKIAASLFEQKAEPKQDIEPF